MSEQEIVEQGWISTQQTEDIPNFTQLWGWLRWSDGREDVWFVTWYDGDWHFEDIDGAYISRNQSIEMGLNTAEVLYYHYLPKGPVNHIAINNDW